MPGSQGEWLSSVCRIRSGLMWCQLLVCVEEMMRFYVECSTRSHPCVVSLLAG